MLFYVFDTEAEAIAAEEEISAIGGAPIVGKNAKTGKETINYGQTIRWAIPKQRIDGKWVFPKVSDVILFDIPQETIDNFNATHTYVLEEHSSDWFDKTVEDI